MSEHLKHPRYQQAITAAQLTERQQTVLDLYLGNHSMRRIGLVLGISEATAREHLDAAIAAIKPHIPKDIAA